VAEVINKQLFRGQPKNRIDRIFVCAAFFVLVIGPVAVASHDRTM
jgi:hypothetical protein